MNREIKFRAWDLANKKLIDDVHIANNHWLNIFFRDSEDEGCMLKMLQFTGLLDKNGKEIYEGDYLKVNGSHILAVEWCNGAFKYVETKSMIEMDFGDGWLHELAKFCRCSSDNKNIEVEVIGNTYENPEIIK